MYPAEIKAEMTALLAELNLIRSQLEDEDELEVMLVGAT